MSYEREEKGHEMGAKLENFVNPMSRSVEEGAFLDYLERKTHRTLQQSIGRLLAQFFCDMGTEEMGRFTDLRNQGLHEMSKVIREALIREGFCMEHNGKVFLPFV